MDILREITDDELNYSISRLKDNLPYAIKDLYYILSAKKSKKDSKKFSNISEKVLPTFYVPQNGIKENCTIFAITGSRDHTVWFFTFEESLDELKLCLKNTKLIKWRKKVLFVTIHREHVEAIFECMEANNYSLQENAEVSYYHLPKDGAKKIKIEIPEGTYVRKLEESDSEICNSLWAYRSLSSLAFVRSLILINGGFGLFNSTNNEILSFAVINDHFATGILTTVESARGKKYGEFIAKLLTLKIDELDLTPTVYIDSKNLPSMNLYQKLGYQRIGDCNWIVIGDENFY